ncbi:MAG: class I SAM-dependent methyltransferase [Thermoplasmatota archaeon]
MAPSPDATPEGWDAVSAAYDDKILPFTSLYAADALAALGVGKESRVLDVAAGSGAFSLLAGRAGAQVLSTDFAPAMVRRVERRARAEGLPIRAAVMDGQRLQVDEGTFDAAASVFGLIFFPDRQAGFRELRRALKPGGRAAVVAWSSPERAPFVSVLREAAARAGVPLPAPKEVPAVFSLADPKKLQDEMESAGFRDVQVTRLFHTWDMVRPEDYFAAVDGTSPVFAPTLAAIGAANVPAVKVALAKLLAETCGAGPTRVPAEAWLGLGRKG